MTLIEPNIHPILVHFTYALMTMGALCALVVALAPPRPWRASLGHAADWMIAFGAIAVILTIGAGFEAYYTVAHDGPAHEAMITHRNWAVPTAVALLALAAWRWTKRRERPSVLFATLLLLAALSLSATAWLGGRLVYGHGLGVSSLPYVTGEGHHHDHGTDHQAVQGMIDDDHDHMDGSAAGSLPHDDDDAGEDGHHHEGHQH